MMCCFYKRVAEAHYPTRTHWHRLSDVKKKKKGADLAQTASAQSFYSLVNPQWVSEAGAGCISRYEECQEVQTTTEKLFKVSLVHF